MGHSKNPMVMVGNRTANVITNLIETVYKSGDFILAINDFLNIFDYFLFTSFKSCVSLCKAKHRELF